jgi:hypothetical protein
MAKGTALHESQLPPPPSFHKEIESHLLSNWWKKAEQEHLQSHYKMNSWSEAPLKQIKQKGYQILDCMWVYTYKLD